MNTPKPDNSERNTRIVDLARQGKAPAEIARELGLGRGIVNGVVRRARDAGALPRTERPATTEHKQEAVAEARLPDEKEEE
jgi:transposase